MNDLDILAPVARSRNLEALRRMSLSLALSALFVAAFAVLASGDPGATLRAFFVVPFRGRATWFSMLEASSPLALCALGALVAFKAGHFSLGGEGQLYAGAFMAAAFGYNAPAGAAGFAIALCAGMLGGMAVALPAALGRRFAGADVLLVSFLSSQVALNVVDWAIGGPYRDVSNNLVAMKALPSATLLPRLAPPSLLTPAPFVATLLAVAMWFALARTKEGTMLTLYGKNPLFARLQGFPVQALSWVPIIAAGAFHGVAGSFLTLGSNGTAVRGMSGGMGWSAIGVALIAGNEALAVPIAALLFAWLDTGARQASILSDLPPDASLAIKALVIMAATARPLLSRIRKRHGDNAEKTEGSPT